MPRFQGDLPERTFLFADAVLDLVEQIPNVPVCWVAIRQLSGRGTSVGANVCEADDALTSAEFTSICNIARREARETQYWLRLCRHRKYLSGSKLDGTITEADEIHAILSTIVRKLQRPET